MQFAAIFLATLSLVAAAPISAVQLESKSTEQAMSGLEGAMTNHRQVQDTLNSQLKNNGAHSNQAALNAFITGADSQIDNAIATASDALSPLTFGLSKAVGNFLLGPFVQSVTNGAEVLLSNLIGGGADLADASLTASLTGNYSKLASFASKNGIDASKLQSLSRELTKTVSGKSKRDDEEASEYDSIDYVKRASDSDLSGIHGSMTNSRQVQDTLNGQLKSHNGHAAQAVINSFITGADSQIDNAIATVSDALAPFSFGLSKAIGNVLLGPFVQSVTNGAEVLVSNLVGGGIDLVSDGGVKMFSKALGNLSKTATKIGLSEEYTKGLDEAHHKLAKLIPKSD